MARCAILAVCLALAAASNAGAQTISVYQTTPDLLEALSQLQALHFAARPEPGQAAPLMWTRTIDSRRSMALERR